MNSIRILITLLILLPFGLKQVWSQGNGVSFEEVFFDTLVVSPFEQSSSFKGSRTIEWDIIHTSLQLRPDIPNRKLHGKARITVTPFRTEREMLMLDARGFDIHSVYIRTDSDSVSPSFTYDQKHLRIRFEKPVKPEDSILITIKYTANPYELSARKASISSGKGLYFIDPWEVNPEKPTHLWTQSATQSASCWFPTIDAPNERFTQELTITVDSNLTTFSNGLLKESVPGENGTRTDRWVQEESHPAYLAVLVAGEFDVVRDTWKSREVNYYTLPEFTPHAQTLFGNTPEMMEYFSSLFGVEYPWEKYSQIVVYDFVAGAMENTSATVFYEAYFATDRDMLDYQFDDIIAHELVHQWFGDLVTCESWAHLALNESFATYGEYLWAEHWFGKDNADHILYKNQQQYMQEFSFKSEPIIYYEYDDQEDLFDSHRYEKGSQVIHMLRNYLGDDVFFDGLHRYLEDFKFNSAEIHDLRQAMEEVSGKDLTWFFDQWFLDDGHPELRIRQEYDPGSATLSVIIEQVQDPDRFRTFRFPLAIDIYYQGNVTRERAFIDRRTQVLKYKVPGPPELVNVDAEKVLLCEKEEDKSVEQYAFQYMVSDLFRDRMEAMEALGKEQRQQHLARAVMLKALKDDYWSIREYVLDIMDPGAFRKNDTLALKVSDMALHDKKASVRNSALELLGDLNFQGIQELTELMVGLDSSMAVRATALRLLSERDMKKALSIADTMEHTDNPSVLRVLADLYRHTGNPKYHDFFKRHIWGIYKWYTSYITRPYTEYLKVQDSDFLQDAVDFLKTVIEHEESDKKKTECKNVLLDLADHFKEEDRKKWLIVQSTLDSINKEKR